MIQKPVNTFSTRLQTLYGSVIMYLAIMDTNSLFVNLINMRLYTAKVTVHCIRTAFLCVLCFNLKIQPFFSNISSGSDLYILLCFFF